MVDQFERRSVIFRTKKPVTITAQDVAVEQAVLKASGEPALGNSGVGTAGTLPYLARKCLRDEVRVYKIGSARAAQSVTVRHM
jgi:hypothetical protein